MSKSGMDKIWAQLKSKHGDEGITDGNEIEPVDFANSIPTGSASLDDALGTWGLPRGYVVQYAGFESSGKTLMALTAIAEWQKKNPDNWAMFVDAEYTYDAAWAEALGVDVDRLMVYKENVGTKIFDRIVGIPAKRNKHSDELKKAKPGILDMEIELGGTGLGLIVVDSVAAIQPPQEETSRSGKDNIALLARFLPPVLRKLTPMLARANVTLIMINQLRFRPDVMYGDPTMAPGGTALKFACAQMINFGVIGGKDSGIFDADDKDVKIGHHVRAKVSKNKKAPPHRKAEFAIEYSKGVVQRSVELRDLSARYGIIQRPNNTIWIFDGEKYKGKGAMAAALQDDDLQKELIDRIIDAKSAGKKQVKVKDEGDDEVC